MRRRTQVTIEDVAAAAGVSRQTVTRAMNDMAEISPETRRRVLETARAMRYRPSRFGRALAMRDQHTVGLVLHDLTNPFYPELASAVVGAAAARGWDMVLADTVHSRDRAADVMNLVRQVDVVVGYPWLVSPDLADVFSGVPFVHIDCEPGGPSAGVVLDAAPAMKDLVQHLHGHGVRHPVALVPAAGDRREDLFREEMVQAGLTVRTVETGDESAERTIAAVTALVGSTEPVDVIFAFNDRMACWVLKALARAGVDVPGTIRVVGVDGVSLGTVVTPELTTLAIDMTAVAVTAVDLAVGMFGDDLPLAGPGVQRPVAHRLVLRESA